MIYDTFNFFNELDILDIRLNELSPFVDAFVLVESTVTFTGEKKPLYFQENKQRYEKFLNKIIHIVVDDCPIVYGNPWILEMLQFDAIQRGLTECKPHDIVLFSNVDEIPRLDLFDTTIMHAQSIVGFEQMLCYYFLDNKVVDEQWIGTRAVKYARMKDIKSLYILRHMQTTETIKNAGWHFSYMGGAGLIRQKIMAFSHQEFNNPTYNTPEHIELSILTKKDLFHRGKKFEQIALSALPVYVQENKELFDHMFLPHEHIVDTVKKAQLMLQRFVRVLFHRFK